MLWKCSGLRISGDDYVAQRNQNFHRHKGLHKSFQIKIEL
jgi:hypothetical protein